MKNTLTFLAAFFSFAALSLAADKKIVLIAGSASHGSGEHEFKAGCLLLEKCLQTTPGVKPVVVLGGWPKDESIFNGAAAVMIYADGGGGHPAIQGDHLRTLGRLMDKGVGLACLHYAVEVPAEKGGSEFLKWIGGYFEMNWSVNPHWTADFKSLPTHPVTRGVRPFSGNDEWYFHMRFPDGMKGTTPILSAVPPASTMNRPDGTHSGNPTVRKEVEAGRPQHVAWVAERADGGRGFGFTGGHYHRNWADENQRKLVLNALLWVAKVEVPAHGVQSAITPADLKENLDDKTTKKKAASSPAIIVPKSETFVSPTTGEKK
jgi:type 1 glutamine amidotransferase